MKSQKTNAFQLAVAGGVLVLVLVCATFAWFAEGNFATVSQILASVSSPDVPSQFNSIQYEQSNNIWSEYSGQNLELVPGKTWKFKVYFTAQPTDVLKMSLTQISAELRKFETETETTSVVAEGSGTEGTSAPVQIYSPVITADMLSEVLLVSVNGGDFKSLTVDASTSSAVIFPKGDDSGEVGDLPDDKTQYEYTYEIMMAEDAANKFMNKELSFVFEAELISSGGSTEAEG